MILAIAIAAVVLALGAGAIWSARRRAQVPVDLCGDWWPKFERQFRAYAAEHGAARSRRTHHRPH